MSEQIQGMVGITLEKMKALIDTDTVIGKPIVTEDGTNIIPVSKVSFGLGMGGGDYPNKKPNSVKELFGGGGGGGVNITPVAFLVVSKSDIKLLQISDYNGTVDRLAAMLPDLVDKVTAMFKKKPDEAVES